MHELEGFFCKTKNPRKIAKFIPREKNTKWAGSVKANSAQCGGWADAHIGLDLAETGTTPSLEEAQAGRWSGLAVWTRRDAASVDCAGSSELLCSCRAEQRPAAAASRLAGRAKERLRDGWRQTWRGRDAP